VAPLNLRNTYGSCGEQIAGQGPKARPERMQTPGTEVNKCES